MVDRPADDAAGAPRAGAAPQQVADLLRTFTPGTSQRPVRRRRRPREDGVGGIEFIVPLLVTPDETPLDPSRIEAARERLKAQSLAAKAAAAAALRGENAGVVADVDPGSFDAARSRLRGGARKRQP